MTIGSLSTQKWPKDETSLFISPLLSSGGDYWFMNVNDQSAYNVPLTVDSSDSDTTSTLTADDWKGLGLPGLQQYSYSAALFQVISHLDTNSTFVIKSYRGSASLTALFWSIGICEADYYVSCCSQWEQWDPSVASPITSVTHLSLSYSIVLSKHTALNCQA